MEMSSDDTEEAADCCPGVDSMMETGEEWSGEPERSIQDSASGQDSSGVRMTRC